MNNETMFSTEELDKGVAFRDAAFELLTALPGAGVCSNRTCLRCRIADAALEVDSILGLKEIPCKKSSGKGWITDRLPVDRQIVTGNFGDCIQRAKWHSKQRRWKYEDMLYDDFVWSWCGPERPVLGWRPEPEPEPSPVVKWRNIAAANKEQENTNE